MLIGWKCFRFSLKAIKKSSWRSYFQFYHIAFNQMQHSQLLVAMIDSCVSLMRHHNCLHSLCVPLRFGDISLQERINQRNFEMLEAYYKSLSEKVPLECKCTISSFILPTANSLYLCKSFLSQKSSSHAQSRRRVESRICTWLFICFCMHWYLMKFTTSRQCEMWVVLSACAH